MTNKEIVEGNKLIAEFCGWNKREQDWRGDNNNLCYDRPDETGCMLITSLNK